MRGGFLIGGEEALSCVLLSARIHDGLQAVKDWDGSAVSYHSHVVEMIRDGSKAAQSPPKDSLYLLFTLCYSAIKLLPYSCGNFCALRGLSPRQTRFTLGRSIRREVFFATLAGRSELGKNASSLLNRLKSLAFDSIWSA